MVPQQHGQHGRFQPQVARAPYGHPSMRSAPVQSYREERSPSPPPRERSRRGASKRVVYKEDFDRYPGTHFLCAEPLLSERNPLWACARSACFGSAPHARFAVSRAGYGAPKTNANPTEAASSIQTTQSQPVMILQRECQDAASCRSKQSN